MKLKKIFETLMLSEKTFDTKSDVDFIMDRGGFNQFLRDFKTGEIEDGLKQRVSRNLPTNFMVFRSNILPSSDSIRANLVNPVTIRCGIFPDGNYYDPNREVIQISININALSVQLDGSEVYGSDRVKRSLNHEITDYRIRASINHEISHWLSDTLHNRHLHKILNLAMEMSDADVIKLGQKDVNMTYFEIDAQIHGIKEIKRKHESNWNQLSLDDLFEMYPPLGSIHTSVLRYGGDISKLWQKQLIKRMHREELLGLNMRKFVR